MARGGEILTNKEREEYTKISDEIPAFELEKFFTLSEEDIKIVNKHRKASSKLGFAIQLCIIRYTGWTLMDFKDIPKQILYYVSRQLDTNFLEFQFYYKRDNTKYEHVDEIIKHYNYKRFKGKEKNYLFNYILSEALKNYNLRQLIDKGMTELKRCKIILPALITIENIVLEAKKQADITIYDLINVSLSDIQKKQLDQVLTIKEPKKTYLTWLREIPGKSSSRTFIEVTDRIEYIRNLELSNINLSHIHNNRIENLFKLGSKYDAFDFMRFNEKKRYSILSVYLINLCKKLIDQAFQIHDNQITSMQSYGRKEQENIMKKNGKKINIGLNNYASLGKALIKAKNEGNDPYKAIEEIMSWDEFVNSVNEADEIARPKEYDYLDLINQRYNTLKKYTPRLLKILEFESSKTAQPVLKALDTIKKLNESKKRKVPKGAPLDFVSKRWEKHVYDEEGNIDKRYYELAAFTEFRNAVRSGDISIIGSKQHKPFEEYLFSKEEWENYKSQNNDFKIPLNAEEYFNERKEILHDKLKYLSDNINSLKGISIDNGKFKLSRLEKAAPVEAKKLADKLYKMIPDVNLTDILFDISKLTCFEKQLIHASTNKAPRDEDRKTITAALIALGTNIGVKKMEKAAKGITYSQMANVSNWRMSDNNMEKAEAVIVNYHKNQLYSQHWGNGTTSSSDGMRIKMAVESLNASHNPHYRAEKGVTVYTFASDQYSRFNTKVINTNSRDAIHVIDGLLHHETELKIEEHYTDTAGYTDQIFGLTHILGFRFAPRLRDISDSKLYFIEKREDFKNIQEVIKGKINTKLIKENYDDILKLAYSIKEGKVSGALIMSKLGSYARQNSLSKALRELGRIEKTIFILDYLSDENFRRRIQIGLNKGEAMNGLARAIFFGKQGMLHEKDIQGQLQRATSLNIIIDAISLWNTIYLSKAVKKLNEKEEVN